MADTKEWPQIGTYWRDKNSREIYRVVGSAIIEATYQWAVVYEPITGGMPWVRPRSEFMDGRLEQLENGDPDCTHRWGIPKYGVQFCKKCGFKR